ncbi:hypothetical protein T190_26935 [Sinorhizobium meliloti CCBAU 01290]|nr:hypothetical protein T190_26935 [Sinorhizobium meliloti CCBAU 01290]
MPNSFHSRKYTLGAKRQEGERVSDADDPSDAKIAERVQLACGAATAALVSKPFQALMVRGADEVEKDGFLGGA